MQMTSPEIHIQKSYCKNPETNAFLLEVALNRYEEIFNEWDPAPFKRRDIDPDLKAYLEGCSHDIHLKSDIELLFTVAEGVKDLEKEGHVRVGLKNFFFHEENVVVREIKQFTRRGAFTAVMAIILLMLMVQINRYESDGFGFNLLREGLTIGAWVFTWESILSFFFHRSEIAGQKKKWHRFANAEITFSHSNEI